MAIKSRIPIHLSRRQFIHGFATASAGAILPSFQALADTPDILNFLKASSVLSGIELDRSYIQLGQQIYDALTENANQRDLKQWRRLIDEIAKLPANASEQRINTKLRLMGAQYREKAKLLAKVWYTGRIWRNDGTPKGTFQVINYDEALVWQACTFTKPPVTCGGHFGYWQHPYTGGA